MDKRTPHRYSPLEYGICGPMRSARILKDIAKHNKSNNIQYWVNHHGSTGSKSEGCECHLVDCTLRMLRVRNYSLVMTEYVSEYGPVIYQCAICWNHVSYDGLLSDVETTFVWLDCEVDYYRCDECMIAGRKLCPAVWVDDAICKQLLLEKIRLMFMCAGDIPYDIKLMIVKIADMVDCTMY